MHATCTRLPRGMRCKYSSVVLCANRTLGRHNRNRRILGDNIGRKPIWTEMKPGGASGQPFPSGSAGRPKPSVAYKLHPRSYRGQAMPALEALSHHRGEVCWQASRLPVWLYIQFQENSVLARHLQDTASPDGPPGTTLARAVRMVSRTGPSRARASHRMVCGESF